MAWKQEESGRQQIAPNDVEHDSLVAMQAGEKG
jgi:hypothetical protein